MGNGVLFNHCCNKPRSNTKDVDINKMNNISNNNSNNINSNVITVKDLYSPGKKIKTKLEEIAKTDIKSGNNKKFTFNRRNLTQGGPKRNINSECIQNQNISLFNTIKHKKIIYYIIIYYYNK